MGHSGSMTWSGSFGSTLAPSGSSPQNRAINRGMKIKIALIGSLLILPLGAAPAEIKSPRDYLGFSVGDDYKLAEWRQITGYFNELAATSNRVKVDVIGQTTLKKPFLRVTISAPENLAKLDRYEE